MDTNLEISKTTDPMEGEQGEVFLPQTGGASVPTDDPAWWRTARAQPVVGGPAPMTVTVPPSKSAPEEAQRLAQDNAALRTTLDALVWGLELLIRDAERPRLVGDVNTHAVNVDYLRVLLDDLSSRDALPYGAWRETVHRDNQEASRG